MQAGRVKLAGLSDEHLISLGADLETKLWTYESQLTEAVKSIDLDAKPTVKGRVKIGLNVSAAGAGLLLSPITYGASLLVTICAIGLTVWDVAEHGSVEWRAIAARRKVKQLEKSICQTRDLLKELWVELSQRFLAS